MALRKSGPFHPESSASKRALFLCCESRRARQGVHSTDAKLLPAETRIIEGRAVTDGTNLMYTCRECERPLNQATEICPFCGADLTLEPAPADSGAPVARKSARRNLIVRWLTWGTMVLAVWAFLWYVLPERRASQAARAAEGSAVEALRRIRGVLVSYSDAQGAYPATLEGLGGPPLVAIREAAQSAQRYGYRIEYNPAQTESDGTVRDFALLARPGNYGYRNFFVNAGGVVRATRDNRPATVEDAPIE